MFFRYMWPALLCALVVLILCVIPGQDIPDVGIINFDKFVHSLMFGGLAFLFSRGFFKQTTYPYLNHHYLLLPIIGCTLYGGLLEILQATVCINRAGDWIDFLFDGLGCITAGIILMLKKDLLIR